MASSANKEASNGIPRQGKGSSSGGYGQGEGGRRRRPAQARASQAYNELGKVAFELLESNEIAHPRLETVAEKIRALNERDKGDGDLVGATAGGTSETHDPSQPPDMPT